MAEVILTVCLIAGIIASSCITLTLLLIALNIINV